MHSDLKYVESLEKEIDKLQSEKAEFPDMYDVILHGCVSKDVMCSYLQSLSDLDALTELKCMYLHKKLIKKGKGKSVDTKFDRPSVVRQPNAQRIPKPSVLGKLTPFSDSLERRYFPKKRSALKTNVSEGLSKPFTAQTLPQTAKKAISNTNVLRPGMVYYVEGLNHNLFLVGQLCDADLEVAFRKSTCFVRDLQGNDLLIEMIAKNAQVENDEFINIFCTSVQDRGETLSRHIDSSNMHTIYQHHPSKHRWTKDHPLEQELHQFDRLDVLELVDRPLCKNVINMKWLWKKQTLMFDVLLKGTTLVVSKSSAVIATDAPNQRQQQNTTPSTSKTIVADIPPLNIQTTPKTTNQLPTVTAIENINQAET
nr:integrase, catalytic region, zinc finger, CCHC-type, peptidase aspartic, catalytic [Tanacetum cinerariifolium]